MISGLPILLFMVFVMGTIMNVTFNGHKSRSKNIILYIQASSAKKLNLNYQLFLNGKKHEKFYQNLYLH